jgi:glycogen operon protein
MSDQAWMADFAKCLGMRLVGDMLGDTDEKGRPIKGDTLLLLLNAHWEEIPFTLPETTAGDIWQILVDTAEPDRPPLEKIYLGRSQFPLYGRSLALLRTMRPEEAKDALSSTQVEALRHDAREPGGPVPPSQTRDPSIP